MPFKSDKQRRFLFAEKPDVAAKFVRDSKKNGGSLKKKTHKMPDGTIMKGAKHK